MDEQNNQDEQQLLTEQETKVDKMAEQAVKKAEDIIVKEPGKKAGKQVGKLALKGITQIIGFIYANLFWVLVIIIIIIILQYIFQQVNALTNLFNGSNSKGITDTKSYITSDANGIILSSDNDIIEIMKEVLTEAGVKGIEDLGLGTEEEAEQYLLKFYKSSIVTQLPYIPGVENISDKYIQGMVHIKRTKTTVEDARELIWMDYEKFKEKIGAENADPNLLNYYSIDENWNLCVAVYTQTLENGVTTSYTITENKIPYQTLISQYSVPLRFIISMQQITQNPEYISKMCDMFIDGKQIDFTIFDSIETTTHTDIYRYNAMSKWIEEVEETKDEILPDGTIISSDPVIVRKQKTSGPTPCEEITINTTITNTIMANVTYARTWLVELTNNYENENTTEFPLGVEGQTTGPESESEPAGEEGSWRIDQYWTVKEQVDKNTWKKVESEPPEVKESEFLGLWRNETGEYVKGADFKSEKSGGKLVYYNIPNARQKHTPMINIYAQQKVLFKLLEDDETTQNYATIMKYLLYKYDGKDYGVTELDLSIFESQEFQVIYSMSTGLGGGLDGFIEWLHAWEGHEGMSLDGTKYKIGTDGLGHPTVGYGIDIFNGGYAEEFKAAGYPITVGSYVDKEFVDNLERREIEECIQYIKNETSSLNLKDYQIYALVSRAYNCGKSGALKARNGKTFVEAYRAYWNEERDDRYGESTVDYSHLLYTQYMKKPDTSDGQYVKGLEERRKAEWALFTTGFYDRTGKFQQSGNGKFLDVAEKLWIEISTSGRYTTYGGANIPVKGPTIDCSSYVCWVLYEYGYTEFAGGQKSTNIFYYTNWNQKYGWEEIPVASGQSPISVLQPGDMFVRYEGHGKGQTHHILIVSEIRDGKIYGYDCGSKDNWLKSGGKAIDRSYFLTKKGNGKILRIKEQNE